MKPLQGAVVVSAALFNYDTVIRDYVGGPKATLGVPMAARAGAVCTAPPPSSVDGEDLASDLRSCIASTHDVGVRLAALQVWLVRARRPERVEATTDPSEPPSYGLEPTLLGAFVLEHPLRPDTILASCSPSNGRRLTDTSARGG